MAVGSLSRSARIVLVSDLSRAFYSPPIQSSSAVYYQGRAWSRRERPCRHFTTQTTPLRVEHSKWRDGASSDDERSNKTKNDKVEMELRQGVPQVLVPLPSSGQPCLFTLRPLVSTVGDLLDMIRKEDSAVAHVAVTTKDNIRIASSNSIANLIEEDFKLTINDKEFYVKAPDRGLEGAQLEKLTEIKSLVSQLYTALNAGEHTARLERELQSELDSLREQIEPLEKKKQELDLVAGRKATALTWVGLGLMSVQFGILARLTWWEYSWDIMEPVTYFVTYGTAMAAYAYFVLTRQDYTLPEVRDRQHLIDVHKRAAKVGLNLDKYNRLKEGITRLEGDLARLRDPLSRIPIQPHLRPVSEAAAQGLQHSSFLRKIKTNIFSLVNLLKRK